MHDPQTGTVTMEADESIVELDTIDLNMAVKMDETEAGFGEHQVFVKERGEENSVSTFRSKRAPPAAIATTTSKKAKTGASSSTKLSNSSTSSTSCLLATTKNSINNRILAIEGFQSEVNSKVDLILKTPNIQMAGQVITPTKILSRPQTRTTKLTIPTLASKANNQL